MFESRRARHFLKNSPISPPEKIVRRTFIEQNDRSGEFAPEFAHVAIVGFRRNLDVARAIRMDAISKTHRDLRSSRPEVALLRWRRNGIVGTRCTNFASSVIRSMWGSASLPRCSPTSDASGVGAREELGAALARSTRAGAGCAPAYVAGGGTDGPVAGDVLRAVGVRPAHPSRNAGRWPGVHAHALP